MQRVQDFFKRNRYAAAFMLGIILTLGLPPLGLFPVIFFVLPLQMQLTAKAPDGKAAFFIGWAFGAGYFIFGLYWFAIGFSEMYDNNKMWFLPLAIFGPPLYIALCYAFASLAAFLFRKQTSIYMLAYAVFFFWAEYMRGHAPMHLPWNLLGSAWYHVLPLLQALSLFGIYGLTFLTLLWATVPFLLLHKERGLTILIIASFLLVLVGGTVRLFQSQTAYRSDLSVHILQPNITREEKRADDYSIKQDSFFRSLALMHQYPDTQSPRTLYIWPETVFDVTEGTSAPQFSKIAALLPAGGYAAVGIHRFVPHKGQAADIFNSLVVIDKTGTVLATYDKASLVPWGEYVPYNDFIRQTPLKKYFFDFSRLAAGPGVRTLRVGKLPAFSPVICYESIFSGAVLPEDDRPDFLMFISNDAWTAGSAGPLQSFSFTRLRAIEEGLPVLRAANIGVSAVFDPYGRELQRLGMNKTGVISTQLPKALSSTIFSHHGNAPLLSLVFLLTFFLATKIPIFSWNNRLCV